MYGKEAFYEHKTSFCQCHKSTPTSEQIQSLPGEDNATLGTHVLRFTCYFMLVFYLKLKDKIVTRETRGPVALFLNSGKLLQIRLWVS